MKYKKKLLWILLTILLGAVGSGLWEIAIKPLCFWFLDCCIDFILSLISALSNSIYQDISRGRTDRIPIFLLSCVTGSVLGLMLITYLRRRKNQTGKGIKKSSNFSFYMQILFICSVIIFSTFKTIIIVSKINDFEHVYNITRPLLSDAEAFKIKSKFAQICSYTDYKEIMFFLVGKSSKKGFVIPKRLSLKYANNANAADAKSRAAD